jgi:dTDP-4-amino-4,6-dideoxygalactose transaminase
VVTPKVAPYAKPVYHLYVVQVPDRKKQQAAFDTANVSHGIHYPIPVHLQPAFADLGYKQGSFPVTEALAPRIISLPMFPEINDSQIERVAAACLKS